MNRGDVSVWVIDSSALIESKLIVSVSKQWDAFKGLEQMVVNGKIAMPRQVIKEVSELTHPDMPGAWASGVRGLLQHPLDADYDQITHVMNVAGDVVDANKPDEDADPYVLALARQLDKAGLKVRIVTEDRVDHDHISIVTACSRLGLEPPCSVRDFFNHCGIETLTKKGSDPG